jgi:hypothetical protein
MFGWEGENIITVAAVLVKNVSFGLTGGWACLSVSLSTKYFIIIADAVSR